MTTDRLSDEELDDLASRARAWDPAPGETSVNETVMAMLASRAVTELRERRAADGRVAELESALRTAIDGWEQTRHEAASHVGYSYPFTADRIEKCRRILDDLDAREPGKAGCRLIRETGGGPGKGTPCGAPVVETLHGCDVCRDHSNFMRRANGMPELP